MARRTTQQRMAETLRGRSHGPDPAEIAAASDAAAAETASREKRRQDVRHVGGYVSPETQRALRIAALNRDTTNQVLIVSAIDTWILGPSEDFERIARERGVEVRDLLADALDWLSAGQARPPRGDQ